MKRRSKKKIERLTILKKGKTSEQAKALNQTVGAVAGNIAIRVQICGVATVRCLDSD
jgi:hypothetical protein